MAHDEERIPKAVSAGVGVSVFRQAYGFEGLRGVKVDLKTNNLATAERPYVRPTSLNLDSAFSSAPVDSKEHYDAVVGFVETLAYQPEVLPGTKPLPHRVAVAFQAAVRASAGKLPRPDGLDFRVEQLLSGPQVAALPFFVYGTQQLHVLLRHRLLREAGGFE